MLAYGIKETTATTGTGTLTLSAVSGFPRFSDVFAVGLPVMYSLLDSSGHPIEIGIGSVGASNTLVRNRIVATYSGGTYNNLTPSAVSLSGTTTVICTGTPSAAMPTYPGVNTVNTYYGNPAQRLLMDTRLNFYNGSSTGLTMVANTLYLVPFVVGADCIATGIMIRVGTGVSGKSIRSGLYAVGANGATAKLIDESASTAAATSGVNLSMSFSGGNKKLPPGMYIAGLVSDGTPAIATVNSMSMFSPLGTTISNNNILTPTNYAVTPHTYGALPSAPATALESVTSSSFPAVGLTIV